MLCRGLQKSDCLVIESRYPCILANSVIKRKCLHALYLTSQVHLIQLSPELTRTLQSPERSIGKKGIVTRDKRGHFFYLSRLSTGRVMHHFALE